MTSPKHAHSTERGRYYTRPGTGEQLISVTNALNALGKPALVPWAAKIAAEHAGDAWPVLTRLMRTDGRQAVVDDIKRQVTVARDKAADLGSRIHAAAERYILASEADRAAVMARMDDDVRPYVEQYIAWLATMGVVTEADVTAFVDAAECTVAHPAEGWAGTLDLRILLPVVPPVGGSGPVWSKDGTRHLWIVDIKTSATREKHSVYPEYALQLAGLATGVEVWTDDGQVHPIPMGRRPVGGAVLNLRQRSHALVPMPIGNAERAAFRAAVRLSTWQHEFKAGHDAKKWADAALRGSKAHPAHTSEPAEQKGAA